MSCLAKRSAKMGDASERMWEDTRKVALRGDGVVGSRVSSGSSRRGNSRMALPRLDISKSCVVGSLRAETSDSCVSPSRPAASDSWAVRVRFAAGNSSSCVRYPSSSTTRLCRWR